ncbi:MAG: Hsp20/alpha crystallin family protein [Paucibacter sp.]|nr:Hsp20/alpha crystallin family protein [Roseateles sp.]
MFLIPLSRSTADLHRRLDRLFAVDPEAVALQSPAIDVSETDTSYVVRLDLPGVDKQAVKIAIDGRRLSVDAEQTRATVEGERVLHAERSLTRFARSLSLPQEISQAESSAKLDNGVLALTLAKRKPDTNGNLIVD